MKTKEIISISIDSKILKAAKAYCKKNKISRSRAFALAIAKMMGVSVAAFLFAGCGDWNPVADACQESNQTLSVNFDNGYPVMNCQTEIPGKVYKVGL